MFKMFKKKSEKTNCTFIGAFRQDLEYIVNSISELEMQKQDFDEEKEKRDKTVEDLKTKLETIKNQIPDFDINVYEKYKEYFDTQEKIETFKKEEKDKYEKYEHRLAQLNDAKVNLMTNIMSMDGGQEDFAKEKERIPYLISLKEEQIENYENDINRQKTHIERMRNELQNTENKLKKFASFTEPNNEQTEELKEQIRHRHFFINETFKKIENLMEAKHKTKCEIHTLQKKLRLFEEWEKYKSDAKVTDEAVKK